MKDISKEEAIRRVKKYTEELEERIAEVSQRVVEYLPSIAEEEKIIRSMDKLKTEEYIMKNVDGILDRFKEDGMCLINRLEVLIQKTPNMKSKERMERKKQYFVEFVAIIKEVLDEEEIFAWGKYPDIVNGLKLWLVRMFILAYKKQQPTLLGMFVEAVTLPFLVAGGMAYNIIEEYKSKSDSINTSKVNYGETIEQQKSKSDSINTSKMNYSEAQTKRIYRNHCWNCWHSITEENDRCSECRWYICPSCGRCSRRCGGVKIKANGHADTIKEELPFS